MYAEHQDMAVVYIIEHVKMPAKVHVYDSKKVSTGVNMAANMHCNENCLSDELSSKTIISPACLIITDRDFHYGENELRKQVKQPEVSSVGCRGKKGLVT